MNLNILIRGKTANEAVEDERLAPERTNIAIFRYYAELNDFLPLDRRQVSFPHVVNGRRSVKDIVESMGIPHTEVDILLANGESVDFSYRVKTGDRISVYPMFESMDIRPLLRVRPSPLRITKFAVDSHLERLARYLRMVGYDAFYDSEARDEMLARTCRVENRILLTRNRELFKCSWVTHGFYIRESLPLQQLIEVIRRFDLQRSMGPFRRCITCNGLLEQISKEAILEPLPFLVRQRKHEFHRCCSCRKVYWEGSHYERLRALCESLMDPAD